MIRRICVALCLKAKTATGRTESSVPSTKHVTGKIRGKHLNPRFGGEQFHCPTRFRIEDRCSMGGRFSPSTEHPHMIVSLAKEELLIFFTDAPADRS